MSGIISVYIPATSFNNTIFVPNSDLTQVSLVGTMTGTPIVATSYVPPNSQFNCQLTANFAFGSDGSDPIEPPKKPKIVIKPPPSKKSAKSPQKPRQSEQGSQEPVKTNPYRKPEDLEPKYPDNDDEPSGSVIGSYSLGHAPWPTEWRIYLIQNLQLTMGGNMVYQFLEACHPDSMTDAYDVSFNAANFYTTGQINATSKSSTTFSLTPKMDAYFDLS